MHPNRIARREAPGSRLLGAALAVVVGLTATAAHAQSTAQITVYGTGDDGACMYGPVPTSGIPFGRIVAVGADLWDDSAGCGRFMELDASEATCYGSPCDFGTDPIVVQVVDQCPECSNDHLDLSTIAWEDLTDDFPPGLVENVTWRYVPGMYPGNVQMQIAPGSSQYWLGMTPRDWNVPITAVEVRSSGSASWQPTPRVAGLNRFLWQFVSTPLVAPVSVRLTDENGMVYEAVDALTSFEGTHDLGFQTDVPPTVPATSFVGRLVLIGTLAIMTVAMLAIRQRRMR